MGYWEEQDRFQRERERIAAEQQQMQARLNETMARTSQPANYGQPVEQYIDNAYSAKRAFNIVFYGMLGVRAGQNWYDVTGDALLSASKGIRAAFRWKIWFGSFTVWLIPMFTWWYMMGVNKEAIIKGDPDAIEHAKRAEMVAGHLPTLPELEMWLGILIVTWMISLGPTYVLAVDASLFKQRRLYKMNYWLAKFTRNVPWWMLTMGTLIPWIAAFALYARG